MGDAEEVETSAFALSLGADLAALPEASMRRQQLARTLAVLPDGDAVTLMGAIARQGRRNGDLEITALALAAVLEHEDLGYDRHVALYLIAKAAGEEVVARLLLTSGRQPGSTRARLGDPVVEPTAPLGWRKAWARQPRRDLIDRLVHDPDPSVLEILLQNPRVIERDAVAVAARRPTTAAAQRVVFASRYAARIDVRRALARNPYTAVELSARILPALAHADVVEVSQSLELAPALRQAASALLTERAQRAF